MVKGKRLTVAQYLEQQIALSPKSQKEIAAEVGYDKPNVMSMLKLGTTKVPINKVGPLAKALGVDPVYFMRLVMTEYMPETWSAIEEVLGAERLVPPAQMKLLQFIRKHTKDAPIDIDDPKDSKILAEALEKITERVLNDRDSAVRAAGKRAA